MGKARRNPGNEQQWNMMYLELEAYRDERGNCNVPKRHGQLGTWVHHQRQARKKGKLSDERIRKLDDLGFDWGTNLGPQRSWDERLEELNKYMDEHGNCDVPRSRGQLGQI
mmetsp:Transcript_38311/g.86207  ORF Transcript_38311/g.86207 Transcript_38311/m.86207 type:complete len:111 (-) Transcript_38311:121-453(-)